MNSKRYRQTLTQFLNNYWGAFHEVLEAQSVMPSRLSGSLFGDLVEEHQRFAASFRSVARPQVDSLERLWKQVEDHRTIAPDAPVSPEQIHEARGYFEGIYDALYALGEPFEGLRADVLAAARHGSPREPLRADASR
ncbi:MAG TPA: hypothetical protein VH701_12060 [Vicinamibacterales bacterium]|jgi:hypothetical protein